MGNRSQKIIRKLFLSFLFLSFLISPLFADDLQKVRINLFDGGQNSSDLSDIINPNQGTLIRNAIISKKGQLYKRKGQSLFASDESETAFTGIGLFSPDINTDYLYAASGQSIIRESFASGEWAIVNSDNLLTAGKDTEFLQANDLFFILNGYDNTAATDGATFDPGSASTASPPVSTTAVWLNNYLFCAGNPNNNDWIYFSNNLEPRTFSASDIRRINTGDGQRIVKLESFKLNEVIIYKTKSIFAMDISNATPANWTIEPITTAIGCIAPRSVVNMGNDHWFLSGEPFAIRSLLRSSFDKLFVDMVSQPIQDIFDGTGETTINKSQADKACAVLFDNKFLLALPTGISTTNNYIVGYDFITKSWFTIDGWYPADWVILNNGLYYIDALDGRVIKCFATEYSDVTSGPVVTVASEPLVAIPFDYRSKSIDFDVPENYKQLDALEVEFEAVGNYTAEVFINLDKSGWQSVGTINFSDDVPTLPNTLPISLVSTNIARKTFQLQRYGEFRKIQIRILQNGVNQQCNLYGYTIFAFVKKWRRE